MSCHFDDRFVDRHIGPREVDIASMLRLIGVESLDDLITQTIPSNIRLHSELNISPGITESEALAELKEIAAENKLWRSYIGMGYSNTFTPSVIRRNVFENPGWYTQYTPYQAEISQGRLEALLNYQTMIADLTALPIANASLLDEGTAAAEAMALCFRRGGGKKSKFFVSSECHPQTIDVVKTRAKHLEIEVVVGDCQKANFDTSYCGALVQYPTSSGVINDYSDLCSVVHEQGALVVCACDLLSLTVLKAPGEWGADIALGNSQRFGVPLGFGGPHAAFFACKAEYTRDMPGRIIGLSKDADGRLGFRLAVQTREQHIRRDKATSNICTAQVLLAVMASMYAIYHGPEGLRGIAKRIGRWTCVLANKLVSSGIGVLDDRVFDTLRLIAPAQSSGVIRSRAKEKQINLRYYDNGDFGVSLDETVNANDVADLFYVFTGKTYSPSEVLALYNEADAVFYNERKSSYLTHAVFNSYYAEHEMLRYIKKLEARDLSLTTSMIPLGSCTMKLTASSEMLPVTWPEFSSIHPFVPLEQVKGYLKIVRQLEQYLCAVTGFAGVSLQPNAGSQGEYTGLLVVREYHEKRGQFQRNVCLIPVSAHGTNPASAALAGLKVVTVACDLEGNIDVDDLKKKAETYKEQLAALMITYPSTHGVFEERVKEICEIIHECGGQVYMDGANMNAQVGFCSPAAIGADVCHLNLHKTFAIPHGGGGPGVGPIAVAEHLVPFLPVHIQVSQNKGDAIGAVSSAPWGSAGILVIPWMYIRMMGYAGLKKATALAIANANYIAARLEPYFPVLYRGKNGFVAHECILDCRAFKRTNGVSVTDIAKRLMDYGFHAPTVSFPVAETLMVEPTESESKEELDRFCDAMINIRAEIKKVEDGVWDRDNNPLKNAPHTALVVSEDEWNFPYSRKEAVFSAPWLSHHKYWPTVRRIDDVYGDRNLCCTCNGVELE